MSSTDSNVYVDKIVSKDIDIEVFVNSSNYIESMNYSIEVAGINEYVEIKLKDYNTSGMVEIPTEVR